MKLFFLAVLILITVSLTAQSTTNDSLSITIHKDPRVDALLKKQADINAAIKRANSRTARGFRLLIVNTIKRDEAIAAKTKIYTYYPELKSYLIYQSPYFKLKAGNFRTREEAEQYKKYLTLYFPKGVFILNDTIEVVPEKETTDQKDQ